MNDAAPIFLFASFLLGAAIGSFLNVVIYRVPRGMSVASPSRSFCPACARAIPWTRNIPILSWLILNGRCADCHASIPIRYLLVELAGAFLFAAVAATHLPASGLLAELGFVPLLVDWTFAGLVLAIAVIDFQLALIPDPLTVPWLPLVCGAAWFDPRVLKGHALDPGVAGEPAAAWVGLLAGVAIGAFPALLFDFLARRRETIDPGREPESALPADDEEFSIFAEARSFLFPLLVPVAVAGGLLAWLAPRLGFLSTPSGGALLASAAGAGAGLLSIYVVRFVFSAVFRREAMGLGDAKFLALAGALFGAEGTLLVFLGASLLGAAPALIGLLARAPFATGGLIVSTLVPVWLLPSAVSSLGPTVAISVLMPIPILGLLLFMRFLRQATFPRTAMPFGPFLAVAALVLLVAADPVYRFAADFLART